MKTNKPRFISLNLKVFLLGVVISLIPMAIIGSLLYKKSLDVIKQKQEAASIYALNNISDNIHVVTDYARNLSLFIIQNSDVREALLADSITEEERLQKLNAADGSLMFYTGQNQSIDSIYIQGENGIVLNAGDIREIDRREEMAEQILKMNGKAVWIGTVKNAEGAVEYLTLIRSIKNIENVKETLGTLWINVPVSKIKQQFAGYIQNCPGYIALVDSAGKVILSEGNKEFGTTDAATIQNIQKGTVINEEKDALMYGVEIPDTGWTLVSGLKISNLLEENHTIQILLFYGIAISMLLCLLTAILFTKVILKPLRLLTVKIQEIKEDNYDVHLDFKSNDEIGVLSSQFNAMTHRMDELVNEVLNGKVLQTEAELKSLQAQISPHFLYNNLDTAYWMSRLEHAEKTGEIVLAIADLYRLTMNSGKKFISVETEIRYIKKYIIIQELRTAYQIGFHIETEENTEKWVTMRFVLQPLVENSVQHGLLPTEKQGDIWIRVYCDDKNLYFEVEDNGEAANIEELEELLRDVNSEEKRGMAIRNIDQRIKLQFGNEYGLFFSNAESGGTIARIVQPLMKYDLESAK